MALPDITDLARRIARSDPDDSNEQIKIRKLLSALRDRVQGEKAHDVRLRLDSALLLAEYLGNMDGGGDEVLRIISRLVASMDPYFSPAVTLRKPKQGEMDLNRAPAAKQRSKVLSAQHEEEHKLMSDMLLGEILVQFGTVNSAQVCEALELQNAKGYRFGDALMELGAATRSDIQSAVAYQENLRREASGDETPAPTAALPSFRPARSDLKLVSDMMLGDLLVKMGKITQEQLEFGLRAQRATGVRIGEALVQGGSTTWKDVEEALKIQNERRVSIL